MVGLALLLPPLRDTDKGPRHLLRALVCFRLLPDLSHAVEPFWTRMERDPLEICRELGVPRHIAVPVNDLLATDQGWRTVWTDHMSGVVVA